MLGWVCFVCVVWVAFVICCFVFVVFFFYFVSLEVICFLRGFGCGGCFEVVGVEKVLT